MSTPMRVKERCSVCGAESDQIVLASTNRFGSPDLDLRPPEMMRSTMCWWIQECPVCHYVSESISDGTDLSREWLQSKEYLLCGGIKFSSSLARRFYRHYLINLERRYTRGAYDAILRAAWSCDDRGDEDNAIYCRKLALEQLEKLMEREQPKLAEERFLMKADLLRRSRQFDKVISEFKGKKLRDKLLNDILAFQVRKSEEKDDNCYRVSDV